MSTPDPGEDLRLAQAAEWLQLLRGRQCDESVVDRWLDWCTQDPRNQQAFESISAVWERAGDLALPTEAGAPAEVAPPGREARPVRRRVAIAASIAAVGLALLVVVAVAIRPPEARVLALESPPGRNTRAELPDGSVIELGGRTAASASYSRRQREVTMSGGQLFVTVAPERDRPFVVDAGGLRVTAVGTAFDVLQEAGRTVVTVMEGRTDVRIAGGSAEATPIRLSAGQQLSYVPGSASLPVRWVDPAVSSAWRTGVLKFVDEPLKNVIATINRYVAREIVIEDPAIGALTFTGTAHLDRIEGWLAALPAVFPVSVLDLPDGRRLVGGPLRETRETSAGP